MGFISVSVHPPDLNLRNMMKTDSGFQMRIVQSIFKHRGHEYLDPKNLAVLSKLTSLNLKIPLLVYLY
jgi:hypothetical protein